MKTKASSASRDDEAGANATQVRQVRLDILEAMLRLENEKGHLAWKISELARAANVSRTLVYYHFGRTKPEILDAGIEVIAEEYFGLTKSRAKLVEQGSGWDSVLHTRTMITQRPSFAIFYLRWRSQKTSAIAKKLAGIDARYEAMLARAFPKLTPSKVTALHGLLYGIVTAPFLTDEAVDVLRDVALRFK